MPYQRCDWNGGVYIFQYSIYGLEEGVKFGDYGPKIQDVSMGRVAVCLSFSSWFEVFGIVQLGWSLDSKPIK